MAFQQFLTLVALSTTVSAILHYGLSYYTTPGTRSFFGKIVIGYAGALWAGALIGGWEFIPGLTIASVPVIPAMLGSLGTIVFAVDVTETLQGRTAKTEWTVPKKKTSKEPQLAEQV